MERLKEQKGVFVVSDSHGVMEFWETAQKGMHRLTARGFPPGASVGVASLRGCGVASLRGCGL